MYRLNRFLGVSAVAVAGIFAAPDASAVTFQGNGSLGSYEADFVYTADSATSASLVITLTNTTPVVNGGYLTAFVFNNPDNAITAASLTVSNPNFSLLGLGVNSLNGAPFGQFDVGASTGSNFEGGGPPQDGIAVGDSAVFTFAFTGSALDGLDEFDFLSELSTGTGSGGGYQAFVARFRGFTDGGSDKVPGGEPDGNPNPGGDPDPNPSADAPEPATAGLLLIGGLALMRRRR